MAQQLTKKTVAFEYLTGGVHAVAALRPSKNILKGAMYELKARGKAYKELELWCISQFGFGLGTETKGRAPPAIGEKRPFKIQSWTGESNSPFGKIPLKTLLGAVKGRYVEVHFVDEKRIIIELLESDPA